MSGVPQGLSEPEAAARLAEFGPNVLRSERQRSAWRLLLAQYASPVVGLLFVATAVSAGLGETADAVAIGCILVINGLVGFFQEHKAERAMAALRSLTAPRARVLRDGRASLVPAACVVPGDLLLLEAGDVVAADARVVESHALQANEAPLTGESVPTDKWLAHCPPEAPLAERHDCVFMGTSITSGSGVAQVATTGARTELGRIASLLATAEDSVTPLQVQLSGISRTLIWLCMLVVALVALIGLARGQSWQDVVITAVSLAVAAVPEGLPAVVTIALALGVQRMAAQQVLVRRLHAIETIGCATVVCTDKTGTLTTGQMRVRELWGAQEQALLFAGAACCDAQLGRDGSTGVGDPTEVALLLAALVRGIRREDIETASPRVAVNPFDPERKRMSVWRADGVLYVKGALDLMLAQCTRIPDGAREAAERMAGEGLRVLAIATGKGNAETGLELLGLVGIADPPRPEAIAAVGLARRAGVRTVMITGDHPVTARAIAREMGILADGESAAELVYARATPADKLRIVKDLKARGAVVAMTGDGVNDAPALREANVGIAMGISGTEVTREAADMILADDNFASVVTALREGRAIFDNIKKTVGYLLAGNVAELMVMLLAAMLALPQPLLPLHILWINLVTDSFPALALATDAPDSDVLARPPRVPGAAMLGRREWSAIMLVASVQAAVALGVFLWALQVRGIDEARNMAFTTLVIGELFRAFGARHPDKPLWELGVATNKPLLMVVVASVALQFGIHHVPLLQALLQIAPIGWADCAVSFLCGLIPLCAIETWKVFVRRAAPGAGRASAESG